VILQTLNELGIALVTGILQGSVYALVALGIVLVHRASGVFNFAQAEFGTTGLFAAYAALTLWGWSYPVAFAFGLAVAVAMGLLTERLVIHPLRNSSRVTLLVGTAGVALAAVGFQFWQFNDTLIMTMPKINDAFFLVPPFGAPVTVQQLITFGVLVVASVDRAEIRWTATAVVEGVAYTVEARLPWRHRIVNPVCSSHSAPNLVAFDDSR